MSNSRDTNERRPDAPVERPTWRFSGRRGTPVHLREQAPAALPKEIRDALVEMTKERRATSRASTAMDFSRPSTTAAPVAASPMPVERRSPREPAPDHVSTSPISGIGDTPRKVDDQRTAPPADGVEAGTRPVDRDDADVPKERPKRPKRRRRRPKVKATHDFTESTSDPVAEAAPDSDPKLGPELERDSELAPREVPEPTCATESGRQAAWELGRLPFMLQAPACDDLPAPEPVDPPRPTGWLPTPRPSSRREPASVELKPMDWLPVSSEPNPHPFDSPDKPRPLHEAIERLSIPLPARERVSLDHDRRAHEQSDPGNPPAARAAQARHRIARRRRTLDDVVERLAAVSSTTP